MNPQGAALLLHRSALGFSVVASVSLGVASASLQAATSREPSTSGDVGYLEGQVMVGPLRPVEQVGVPSPTPPPDLCASLGLIVASADGVTEVARVNPRPDCSYRVALKPGEYMVRLAAGGLRRARNLPATVRIDSGKTTRLDVSVDTGIR